MEGDCEYIELLQLQRLVKGALETVLPDRFWVKAELASVQAKSNGHCYLELSQSDGTGVVAKARAVIWRNRFSAIRAYFHAATGSDFQVGMTILARAQVSYSELYGLTLVIDEVEPQFTLGEAELRRRQTIEKLKADGMLDRQKELETAPLPYRLAVISARDAAGYGDFRRHLDENEYGFVFEPVLFEALMQGADAPQSICEALESVETSDEGFDAVLILRGGGSNLDLICFDDYSLAMSIANCSIPVFTAIGHDRDYHVADMVAHYSVKTPTALADVFIDAFAAEDENISSFGTRLALAFSNKISAMASKLDQLESRILSADPRSVLKRGYTLVTDERGVVFKNSASLKKGDRLRLYFSDGQLPVEVI